MSNGRVGDVTDELVTLERGEDGVALVRLRNGKVNALSSEVLVALKEIAEDLTESPAGAVVIAGGDRIFAAGAEIAEFAGPDEAMRIGRLFLETLGAVASIPSVVIAAVNGPALGGGCELALACDLRIAADNAKFGQPEILLGIIPGGGGTQRLARLVGPSRAKDLILTGRQVRAEEALAIGLVNEVHPAADVLGRALALAAELAAGPVAAQRLAKQVIDAGLETTLDAGLKLEQDAFVAVFATEDARIGVASFLESGPGRAIFTGR